MSHDDRDWQIAVYQQARMFRLAERDYGLSRATISRDTGLHVSTLKSYCNETIIPLHNLRKIARVIPDELVSLLLTGTGKHIETSDTDEGDLDELGCETAGFTSEYVQAKADGIVTPMERAKLVERASRIAAKANAVAA